MVLRLELPTPTGRDYLDASLCEPHGAYDSDTSRQSLTPQFSGFYVISLGLLQNLSDDHAMLRHGIDGGV